MAPIQQHLPSSKKSPLPLYKRNHPIALTVNQQHFLALHKIPASLDLIEELYI
jgi:hypothetical protein